MDLSNSSLRYSSFLILSDTSLNEQYKYLSIFFTFHSKYLYSLFLHLNLLTKLGISLLFLNELKTDSILPISSECINFNIFLFLNSDNSYPKSFSHSSFKRIIIEESSMIQKRSILTKKKFSNSSFFFWRFSIKFISFVKSTNNSMAPKSSSSIYIGLELATCHIISLSHTTL